tara:strand:+ start:170 stop:859 length:690 start_codon:yes stop_codon:yes gene_type:complete
MDNRIAQLQEGQRRLRTPTQLDNMPQSNQPAIGGQQPAMGGQQPAMGMPQGQPNQMAQQTPMSNPVVNQDIDLLEQRGTLHEILFTPSPQLDGDPLAVRILEAKLGSTIQNLLNLASNETKAMESGGLISLAAGGEFSGPVPGDGHGMQDNVMMPIKEGEEQVATLAVSPTEYVVDSYTMAALGNGNPAEGAEVMDEVVENVREKAYGTNQQPNEISGLAALRPMIERV